MAKPRGASLRLAVAVTPATEASFVALVTAARAAKRTKVAVVVPALDYAVTTARVAELVGDGPPVVVEPVAEYLSRGHDRALLVTDAPSALGRQTVEAIEWIADPGNSADGVGPPPGQVVAFLAGVQPFESVDRRPTTVVAEGTVLTATPWGGPLLALAYDGEDAVGVVRFGTYDPGLVRFMERTLSAGEHALNVGAGVGVFTVRMALIVGSTGSVTAYEADPRMCELLSRNVEINGVGLWTRVEPTDVVDTSGIEGELAVVLVDAEGAERRVLESLRDVIAARRVRHLVIGYAEDVLAAEREPLDRLLGTYEREYRATFAVIAHDGAPRPCRLDDEALGERYSRLLVTFPS